TFAGVFTPSILTILGVIMYLRLPWIVGQGGLWMSIGIIVVAHIISFTTGLSVASIATDKKVKAGGSYYMISRSLGLPIGGTLGIALFVGMSFSISLYLIGFSESFLSFWGMEKSIHNIRLVGSASLFIVAVITIISTSLAMKTQYLIMTAILVSLVSVIFGKSNNPGFVPHLKPLPGAESFATLFGIFFPAVTGFEAGVSMSGDLQNPKRSIPIGTITAIIVGFIVYLGLAVFFAYRVDSKALSSDGDVLQKISFSVPLLLAGIWGATISSAIGSILGAPRVLQATSMDRITPSIFARGYGKTEEPRNALLLTIFIAEVGILIGELEIIARVVSMFFITAYGFLNLSCVIENWVSPDFRPEFKIPSWVGLLGTITCLIIMIQLDLLAMLGATFIMSLLFLYIKKRELNLEGGDALKSIWSSLVRYGLYNLSHGSMHQRNWRPNILLFSGGTESRPYLVQLSRALADKRGIITNFHLLEKKDENPVARSRILSDEAEESEGIFTRVMECEDVYGEISQISRFHGFSGIEPNTVFLGRAKNLSNAEKFAELICDFENMDYNVLMLDYNKERGFGDMSSVDIWWSGHGNNLSFAFSLARYLQSSVSWSSAEFRFLLISSDRSKLESMGLRLESILAEYRLHGKVKVIYNEDNKRPFYDVIQEESRGTDLVFLGLPNYRMEDVFSIDRKISHFSKSLGSILWIKASSYFHRISFGSSVVEKKKEVEQESLPGYDFGNHPIIKDLLNSNLKNLENLLIQFYDSSFSSFYDGQYYFLKKFRDEIEKTYKEIHHPPKVKKSIDYLDVDLYELLYSYGKEELVSVLEIMKQNEETAIHKLNDYLRSLPSRVSISKRVEDLKKEYEGAFSEKFLGIFPKKKHNYSIQYREIMRYFIDEFISSEVKYYSRKILEQSYEMLQEIYKLRTFVTEEKCKEFNKKEKQNRQKLFIQYLEETDILLLNIGKEELLNKKKLLSGVRVFLQRSRDIFEHPDSNRYFNKTYKH
ncbi:MAG: amino acid permease, partial [Leptospiraceae bacterium]|nr:amino acid permease [Leptospiraceae bacterium]